MHTYKTHIQNKTQLFNLEYEWVVQIELCFVCTMYTKQMQIMFMLYTPYRLRRQPTKFTVKANELQGRDKLLLNIE